jgi:hypothetical protein
MPSGARLGEHTSVAAMQPLEPAAQVTREMSPDDVLRFSGAAALDAGVPASLCLERWEGDAQGSVDMSTAPNGEIAGAEAAGRARKHRNKPTISIGPRDVTCSYVSC